MLAATPRTRFHAVTIAIALLLPALAAAQKTVDEKPKRARKPLKLSAELKLGLRHSDELSFRLGTPVPADFFRPGADAIFLRTPDPGTSLELQNIALQADYEPNEVIAARVRVHALDLHARNPTSIDDRIFVREAWIRFGTRHPTLKPAPGASFYALVGRAPRFTKPPNRELESYGLWSTAIGRFEQDQLQLGGSLGANVYFRAHVANRNPLFMRDSNALAGDNGTEDRVPGNNDPRFGSGFPILYDTLPSDVSLDDGLEVGGGLGIRFKRDGSRDALDILGWAFRGELAERTRLRGTFYSGDLGLLEGSASANPLPFDGNDKLELGVTATARLGRLRFMGQYNYQEIASLERRGFETELAYRIPLGGLTAIGDQSAFNWLSLAFRFSNLDNDFAIPRGFVAPSMGWDWRKYDIGLRLGIVRNVDLTAEYARHDMVTAGGTLHPDELLITMTVGLR